MFFGGGGGGFPFGGMGMDDDDDMGGFPGMHGRGPAKEVDTQGLYDEIGVAKDATMDQIKKAYRKLAIKHHPDKGGDQEKFQKIQNAYDILSDRDKRDIYDKHGEEGVKGGGGAHAQGMDDILNMFMGGKGPGGAAKKKAQVKPITK